MTTTTTDVDHGVTISTSTHEPPRIAAEIDPSAMRYPIAGADGQVFDLAIEWRQPDPFYDECPPWCENVLVGRRHGIESNDEDRAHFGVRIGIPVRSIWAEFETGPGEESRHVIGTAQVYLRRLVLRRDPTIWLGSGESGTGFDLTLDEAEQIAGVLLRLVEAAR